MTTNGNQKPSFEMSMDTRLVFDRLTACKVGETVTLEELTSILGRPVGGGSPHVQSALRSALSDGALFDSVRGVGYKRLADTEIVKTAERERVGLRRKAHRAIKRLTCVSDFEALPNDLKIKHNAAVSGFNAIASVMAPASLKKLEAAVEKAANQLPLAKTLEAFKA